MNCEFEEIRPFAAGEVKGAVESLLADRQFSRILKGFVPWMPKWMRNGLIRLAFVGVNTPLQFQLRFIKPVLKRILRKCSSGYTFAYSGIAPGPERYTFISNHRDIVLDSAILDLMLHDAGFPTTVEIAIGDNLLIYPWIRTLVRLNKTFIVQRSLSMREMLNASQTMSRYMHFVVNEKHENIWIAQREGRAKDSDDRTQDSVLKMMVLGGDGSAVERLQHMHLVPLALSYEYDPCDYLKASEFQLKRDVKGFKKSKQDDLDNMRTGIFGRKGHVHFQTTPCLDGWLAGLDPSLPKTELFPLVAQQIDRAIHSSYRLYASNLVAADMLSAEAERHPRYSDSARKAFDDYLDERVAKAGERVKAAGVEPDEAFLRERIIIMYANPVFNYEKAIAADNPRP